MKKSLVCGVLLSGALSWVTVAKDPVKIAPAKPPSSPITVFQCVSFNGNYATIAKRGDRTTPPMIEWTSSIGTGWTPERRCQEVSQRLTRAVASSGGKLRDLQLTYGSVNGSRVICYVNADSVVNACNRRNLLFTLRREDLNKEKMILETLVKFSINGSGSHVQQAGELYYARLGEAIDDSLRESVTTAPGTNQGI